MVHAKKPRSETKADSQKPHFTGKGMVEPRRSALFEVQGIYDVTLREGEATKLWVDGQQVAIKLTSILEGTDIPKKEAELIIGNHYVSIMENCAKFDNEARILEAIELLMREPIEKNTMDVLAILSAQSPFQSIKDAAGKAVETFKQ